MKLALAFVLAMAIAGLALAAPYSTCWPQYRSCSERCCDNVDGSFSENSDGVYCDGLSDSELQQYFSCDDSCVVSELNCLAPGSGCASQYSSCVNGCSSPSSDCAYDCSDDAFDCADAAMESDDGGSGSCCGGGFILAGVGLAGLLLASRR